MNESIENDENLPQLSKEERWKRREDKGRGPFQPVSNNSLLLVHSRGIKIKIKEDAIAA